MQLPAPFGKYELLERIATGGMAEVYLARSFGVAGFEKRLVIKRIRPELARDPRFVSMFINEAKLGVHLNHPNIVQVYDLGKVGSSYYIAMEHLHGRDLTRLVKTLRPQGEKLSIPVCVHLVAEVCRGLAYAHARSDTEGNLLGLVHRDVSPHNCVVTFDGEVKLVDFGVARLMNTVEGRHEQRAPGTPGGGKYAYMSPEQARGDAVDHRTDIFSAGIVLWELLVGHRLFQDPDPQRKLRQVVGAVIPDPRTEGVAIDDGLWDILRRALARDREDRYDRASVFEEDLRAWLFQRGEPTGAADVSWWMRHAFPELADASRVDAGLSRMVADVERLDAPEPSEATPAVTPSGPPLPGRLRAPEGERKNVAVVVVDVDGLTELSTRIEPEDLFHRHYRLLRWLRRVVDRYGGVVQRAIDDEIVLFFGAPRAHVDDVARALECALELQRTVGSLRSRGLALTLSIGVHLGEVWVNTTRTSLRYTARGDATRFAQRLSVTADVGDVLASERALRAAEATHRFRAGPWVPGRKGRPDRPTFVLEGRRYGPRVGGRGRWLRRGNELDVLRDALLALSQGRGATIGLRGGMGAGKSRLVREIRELARRRGLPFYLGRCAPWGADANTEPFREVVRELLGAEADTPRAELQERAQRLVQLGLSDAEVDAVASVVGAADRPAAAEDVWRALARAIDGLCHEGPLIVALEDVHLLATAERRRLAHLVKAALDGPVLFLFTVQGALPEPLRDLGSVVELGAFEGDDLRRLITSLLEVEEADEALFALVARTCEGNPLYVEEMIKFLISRDLIRVEDGNASLAGDLAEPALPDSLAAIVGARIDALDPASKGALQLAAIAGPTFTAALLGEAAGVADATPLVTDLASHGLIVRTDAASRGDEWGFASDLVRNAALHGILGVQRRDYHRLVASAIEAMHAGDLDEHAARLAHHCAAGGRHLDAARYAYKAGERFERDGLLERARLTWQSGLKWIQQVPEEPESWEARVQGEATLHYRLGVVSTLLGEDRLGDRSLQLALDIASDAGLPWIEVRAHVALGRSYLHRSLTRLAAAHLQQARNLLQQEADDALLLETLEASAILAHEEGRNEDAEGLWQEALRLAEGDPNATARCLVGLANRHLRASRNDLAAPLLDRALHAAHASGDRLLEGRVLNNIGLLRASEGDPAGALDHFRQALQVREGIGYTRGAMVNYHNIGDAHFAQGDLARAWVAFERSRQLATEIGWDRGVALNDVFLGYIDASRGREVEGLERLDRATAAAREMGDIEIGTNGALLAGRWMLEHGRREEGEARLRAALDEARAYGLLAVVDEIETLLDEARLTGAAPAAAD